MKKGFYVNKSNTHSINSTPQILKKNAQGPAIQIHSKNRLAEQMIAQVDKLPPLPSVATQIMKLIEDETSTAKSFEDLLKQDVSLTGRLLRLVNSSFFGFSNKIGSISQAIVVIGLKSLKNLVLAASVNKMMDGQFPGYGYTDSGLWQHSFMTAQWSEKIAKELSWNTEEREEIFVTGLLHDIGKLVMSTYVSKHVQEMIATLIENGGDIIAAENKLVGITHAEVGAYIADSWNFPPQLSFIIKDHHNTTPNKFEKESAILQFVNHLINENNIGMFENFPIHKELPENCLAILGIDFGAIPDIQQSILNSTGNQKDEF